MRTEEKSSVFWPFCCGCESSSEEGVNDFITTSPVRQGPRTTKPENPYEGSTDQAVHEIMKEKRLF